MSTSPTPLGQPTLSGECQPLDEVQTMTMRKQISEMLVHPIVAMLIAVAIILGSSVLAGLGAEAAGPLITPYLKWGIELPDHLAFLATTTICLAVIPFAIAKGAAWLCGVLLEFLLEQVESDHGAPAQRTNRLC